jgi:hypothetical protein
MHSSLNSSKFTAVDFHEGSAIPFIDSARISTSSLVAPGGGGLGGSRRLST